MIVSAAELRPGSIRRLGAFVTESRRHLPRLSLSTPLSTSISKDLQSLAEKVGSAFHPFLHEEKVLFEDGFHSVQLDEVHVFEITTANGRPALVIAVKSTAACFEANANGSCQVRRSVSARAIEILSAHLDGAEIRAIEPARDWPIIETLPRTSLLPFPAGDIPSNLILLLLTPANA